MLFCLFFTLLLVPRPVFGDDGTITFKRSKAGPVVHTIASLHDQYDVESITVADPLIGTTVEYQGIPLKTLMRDIYGETWPALDELLITCADGYQPSLPARELEQFEAYLVFARTDGTPFTFLKKNQPVELGPFYLVWRGNAVSGSAVWSYQMVAMEPISFADRFPRLAPPEDSGPLVMEGFKTFRHYCVNCHQINGQGGNLSVELNYPVNVTEYWRPEYLNQWLLNPESIRHAAKMPAFKPEDADREERIKEVIAYLEAMVAKKIKP